jgi:hypothetical protein
LRTWIGHIGAWILALVLLVAVGGKVLNPAAFAQQIVTEGLAGPFPPMLLALLGLGLEAGLAACLLLGIRHRSLLGVTAFLVTFFLLLTGRTYWQFLHGTLPETSSCGCFGYLIERSPAEAFFGDLGLLLLPLVLLLGAAWGQAAPLPRRRLAVAMVISLGVMGLAFKAPSLPVDDLATRLRPGVVLNTLCAGGEDRVCLTEAAPELLEGHHWVVLSALDEGLKTHCDALNQHVWADSEGTERIWVLSTASASEVEEFRFTAGPAFELLGEIPGTLLAPLYRTLPRSFEVLDGKVVRTWAGWPPWLEGKP